MAAPVEPRNAGDWKRATLRQGREPLPQGRPVLKITEKQREVLLEKFRVWLLGKGVIAAELFADTYHHVEEINCLLSMYGRELYKAGRPLAHYSETINAISSWKPQLRRVLQGSWDLAYSWVRSAPHGYATSGAARVRDMLPDLGLGQSGWLSCSRLGRAPTSRRDFPVEKTGPSITFRFRWHYAFHFVGHQ